MRFIRTMYPVVQARSLGLWPTPTARTVRPSRLASSKTSSRSRSDAGSKIDKGLQRKVPAQFSKTVRSAGTVTGLRALTMSVVDMDAKLGEVAIPDEPQVDMGRLSGGSSSETGWLYKILQGGRFREVGYAQRLMTWFRIPFHEPIESREWRACDQRDATPGSNEIDWARFAWFGNFQNLLLQL